MRVDEGNVVEGGNGTNRCSSVVAGIPKTAQPLEADAGICTYCIPLIKISGKASQDARGKQTPSFQ
jgi:hypothetical protein